MRASLYRKREVRYAQLPRDLLKGTAAGAGRPRTLYLTLGLAAPAKSASLGPRRRGQCGFHATGKRVRDLPITRGWSS
jgi:hypothetical protein